MRLPAWQSLSATFAIILQHFAIILQHYVAVAVPAFEHLTELIERIKAYWQARKPG